MKAITSIVLVGVLSACQLRATETVCAANYVWGLAVQVKDSATGQWAASGAELQIRDPSGTLVTSLVSMSSFPPDHPELDSRALTGAGEQAGTFQVTVLKAGYRDWVRPGVVVRRDACHVERTELTALLQRS
jgi:hypothetical protein